jgi:ABC-type sugar transport system permease subunit
MEVKMKKTKERKGYFFITPFFLVFALFNVYPILFTLYLSMTRFKGYGPQVFIGAENFKLVFNDPNVVDAFFNTIRICLLYTSPSPRDRQKSRMPSSA